MGIKDSAKRIADAVSDGLKALDEHLSPDATILSGFKRSIQLDLYSCGVQSVYMILDYYGKNVTHQTLERKLGTDDEGTPTSDIRRVFNRYGFRCSIKKHASIRDLKKAIDFGCPVLVSTYDGEHWVVVYGYSSAHVFVCDPSPKKNLGVRISNARFCEQWDKWMMVVKE